MNRIKANTSQFDAAILSADGINHRRLLGCGRHGPRADGCVAGRSSERRAVAASAADCGDMMDLRSMAAALGGDVMKGKRGPFVLCPGPQHSAKDRSLSVAPSATDPDGFICFSHANDAWQDCRDHVRARLNLPGFQPSRRDSTQPRREPPAQPKPAPPATDNSASANRIWREATHPDPRGTLVQRYLNEERHIDLLDDLCGRVVRFHALCPWEKERRPCMVVAFRSIADDTLVAIQRTLLSDDGKKLDRKTLGPCGGAAIKIAADEDIEQGLHVGEGLETCLTAHALGLRPVWALGSASAIGDFPVLGGIDALTILGETDKKGSNANAVADCGARWTAAGREVLLVTPPTGDMNDLVKS
jgi:putative DNA primase/helicase